AQRPIHARRAHRLRERRRAEGLLSGAGLLRLLPCHSVELPVPIQLLALLRGIGWSSALVILRVPLQDGVDNWDEGVDGPQLVLAEVLQHAGELDAASPLLVVQLL